MKLAAGALAAFLAFSASGCAAETAPAPTADRASLAIDGESSAGKVTGEVLLVRTKSGWGVDEEIVDLKFD